MQKQLTDYFDSPSLNETKLSGKLTLLNISPALNPKNILSPVNRRKKLKKNTNLSQTIIDAGQKKIGLQHCIKVLYKNNNFKRINI